MKNLILVNVVFNVLVASIFVYLNTWAQKSNLEETFVSFAMVYGLVTVIGNGVFIKLSHV